MNDKSKDGLANIGIGIIAWMTPSAYISTVVAFAFLAVGIKQFFFGIGDS